MEDIQGCVCMHVVSYINGIKVVTHTARVTVNASIFKDDTLRCCTLTAPVFDLHSQIFIYMKDKSWLVITFLNHH
jgi:hypothetical protein